MTITFRCPHCRSELSFDDLSKPHAPCPRCSKDIPLHISHAMREQNVVDRCALCECPNVYMQKDFNRTFGIVLFLLAAAVSCWLYFYNKVWQAFAVLLGAATIDFLLYRILPNVIICYRCHSQYRAFAVDAKYQPFELGLAEKYDPKDKQQGAENPATEWKQR